MTRYRSRLARSLAKARATVLDAALNIWEPDKPEDPTDGIFTDETKDPDDEIAVVHGLGDIDEEGDAEDTLHKRDPSGVKTDKPPKQGPGPGPRAMAKRRKYIGDPKQAPEGSNPQRGKRGGWYVETEGAPSGGEKPGGGAATRTGWPGNVEGKNWKEAFGNFLAQLDPAARANRDIVKSLHDIFKSHGEDEPEQQMSRAIKAVDGIVRKGKLSDSVGEAISDLQQASASLEEIGESLGNVGKAVSCKSCGGKIGAMRRKAYVKMMKQRGWTPESHQAFWQKISGAIDKGEPGGHRACVSRMQGKVDDAHAYCAWAEKEGTGHWPSEKR